MIVKNEEAMLPRCLDSVHHMVDEMVIVDTGSTDSTIEIAERYGARVFSYPWNGSFADARNYAMQQAKMDWIFIMDADDELPPEDTGKLRELTSGSLPATAWFCKTISYLGDVPNPGNVICNLNIYLVRNHMGYRFTGDIHEQIACADPVQKTTTAISDMRIYHYGYLNGAIRSQGKRERNMAMILRELEKRPDDPFMLYNLGNEYFALSKVQKAYDCYLKSYAHFDPEVGYSTKLIMRIVACCDTLGETAEQLKFIEIGLKHYPAYTDLEFIRGTLWLSKERYLAAIRSYKKCLKMGEAPLLLSNIPGVGTYKAAQMLCQLHYNLGETSAAMRYARMALKFRPANREVIGHLATMLMEQGSPEAAASRLSRTLPALPNKYLLLSDAFYSLHRWETALSLARRAALRGEDTATARYDQAVCLMYLKRYDEALRFFRQLDGTAYERQAAFLGRLCVLFSGTASDTEPPDSNEAYYVVLRRYEELMAGHGCAPLATDEETSAPYITPIFNLLNILLRTGHFDEFDKARRLLNLVTDDTVLMRLGKLYFHNGYLGLAYRELERSIRLAGKTDVEALRMMKYVLDSKKLGLHSK
jgi:tetratricopeptide (TPR) repeat protein